METDQTITGPGTSKTRIAIALLFVVVGVAVIVKSAMTTKDAILYALGAVLIVNGVMRFRHKST